MDHTISAYKCHPTDIDDGSDDSDSPAIAFSLPSSSDHTSHPATGDRQSNEDSDEDVSRPLNPDERDPWELRYEQIYNGRNCLPLWRFGYAFKWEAAFEYAKHHKLKCLSTDEEGAETLNFDEFVSQVGGSPAEVAGIAIILMAIDLSKKCGMRLDTAQTLSLEHRFVLYLWTNYNYDGRMQSCGNYDFVLDTLDTALKPLSGAVVNTLWYIDLEDDCLIGVIQLKYGR
ncbi:uncharacterized protein BXZ73DRAFT_78171 [Epithele typhae]|uniref:uncharacterized protein n=1 Tax=Epithele typhae TaxID=378194 RepID=UPI002008C89B|nr:uncharacterized protein BXZ73DRAFT_78171 [Epithele typhae]KAH9929011.1 hypothetical protein BXZ73DRAFT_78171 [Epithele typhae]